MHPHCGQNTVISKMEKTSVRERQKENDILLLELRRKNEHHTDLWHIVFCIPGLRPQTNRVLEEFCIDSNTHQLNKRLNHLFDKYKNSLNLQE